METEHINFKEAIEYIANLYGIALPKIERKKEVKKEEIDELELIYKINEESCKFFEKNIFEFFGKPGLDYAIKRGLTKKDIKKFRIGFAIDDFSMLLNYLKSLNFNENIIEKSGVIAKNSKGNYYDKFRNRLMFPVLDKKGKVIAFTGRILDDGMPKYMNSPETKIYIKGNTLFNFYFAKDAIYRQNSAILVEGNMDALSLFICGVENVVAPMGTGITENQIKELWKSTDNIFVCLDGDSAGQKASKRLAKLVLPLISIGKNINFVFLPIDIDPDDFIRKYGKNEFDNLIKKSSSLSDYLWDIELQELDIKENDIIIPERKAELEKNIFKLVDSMKDIKLKSHFEQFYRNKLWKFGNHFQNNKKNSPIRSEIKNINIDVDLVEKKEKKICALLIKFPNLCKMLYDDYNIDIFDTIFLNDRCNLIISIIQDYLNSSNNEKNIEKLLVKNGLNDYINDSSIIFNNSYGRITEIKGLKILNILLLEKKVMLLEFDLKEASSVGDIAKTNKLSEELKKLRIKIDSLLTEFDFI